MPTVLTPDICVIGGGSAGLTVAAAAAGFGVPVVLVERDRMGGDCLNTGCVPSKALIAAARHRRAAVDAADFGIEATSSVRFDRVHHHIHDVIATIAPHDSVERFEGLGVTVLKQNGAFLDDRTVAAGDHLIRARRTVIATGSVAAVPPIEGLAGTPFLTNESVFDLTQLPQRLAVIGGGPIGVELAQAFRRLGSEVAIVEREKNIMAKDDLELVAIVRRQLEADAIEIVETADVGSVEHSPDGGFVLRVGGRDGAAGEAVAASALLVATGRRPVLAGLGLDNAGIDHGPAGITVDGGLRTSNRRVYAIGDCNGLQQFTHVAGHQASLVVRQILFRLPGRFRPELMPRTTYTTPELAQVGLTEDEARERHGDKVRVVRGPLGGNDRAATERRRDGLVKLVATKSGTIVGAGIVAPDAGEMLAPYVLAVQAGVRMKAFASAVFPYPTMAEAGKAAAVDFYKPKLTSGAIRRMVEVLRKLG